MIHWYGNANLKHYAGFVKFNGWFVNKQSVNREFLIRTQSLAGAVRILLQQQYWFRKNIGIAVATRLILFLDIGFYDKDLQYTSHYYCKLLCNFIHLNAVRG